MLYMIYLVGAIFLLMNGIGFDRFFANYLDIYTLGFVLLPCVLVLFCTGSLKAFGRAFLLIFGRGDTSLISYEESTQAVRMVMLTAGVFGGIGFIAGMINSIRSLDFSLPDVYGWFLRDASTAMLSLFYPLLVCVILLPVCYMLNRHIEDKKSK